MTTDPPSYKGKLGTQGIDPTISILTCVLYTGFYRFVLDFIVGNSFELFWILSFGNGY